MGTADGKILHIEKGNIQVVAELGQKPCGTKLSAFLKCYAHLLYS